MPCASAIDHMIAGVTAAPRWQWPRAEGDRSPKVWRAIALRIPSARHRGEGGAISRRATTRPSASIVAWRRRSALQARRGPGRGRGERADERTGFDVPEAEIEGLDLHRGELVRMVITLDGEVRERRAKVLADGQNVAVDLAGARRLCTSSTVFFQRRPLIVLRRVHLDAEFVARPSPARAPRASDHTGRAAEPPATAAAPSRDCG